MPFTGKCVNKGRSEVVSGVLFGEELAGTNLQHTRFWLLSVPRGITGKEWGISEIVGTDERK
jgi:hypothetical protein